MSDHRSGQVAHVFLDMLSAIDYERLHDGVDDPHTAVAMALAAQRFSEIPGYTLQVESLGGESVRVGVDLTPLLSGAVRLLNVLVQHVVDTTPLNDEHEVITALRARIDATDATGSSSADALI